MTEPPYSEAWFAGHFLRTGTKQADLYHELNRSLPGGISRDKVSKTVGGKRKPQPQEIPIIWRFFDVVPARIEEARKAMAPDPQKPDVEIGATTNFPNFGPRDVPVMQTAQGGDDGDMIFTEDVLDYIRRPPSLHGQRVFAAYVAGDSMSPKWLPGDPVYAYKSRPTGPGDFVILEMRPREGSSERRGFIKLLVRKTAKAWLCEQFNPPKSVEYKNEDVVKVYRVIPLSELLG